MKIIPNEVLERLSYNPETGVFIWIKNNKSGRKLIGKDPTSANNHGHLKICISGYRYYAHRIAWFFVTGDQPNVIDHINGDPSDNRFCNLRNCTQAENMMNHGCKTNKSGLPCGVTVTPAGRYRARIEHNGQVFRMGMFSTAEQAEAAYLNKRSELFKEFHRV